jgi:hypothetical protein
VNAKMIPVETIPEIGGGRIKESSGGVNSNIIYLVHCKNLWPPPSTTIKGKKVNELKKNIMYFIICKLCAMQSVYQ